MIYEYRACLVLTLKARLSTHGDVEVDGRAVCAGKKAV